MPSGVHTSALSQPRFSHQRHLSTVAQFCAKYPAFSLGGLRWLLFRREQNGLDCAVINIGRKFLIDEDLFFQWLDEQQEQVG